MQPTNLTDETANIIQQAQLRLSEHYGTDSYYTQTYRSHERNYWGPIPDWIATYKKERSRDTPDLDPLRVLDIGAAYGTLAAVCSVMGMNVTTVDRLPYLDPGVSGEFGIGVVKLDVERQAFYGDYDIIILTEVLEHFNFHPRKTIRKILALMRRFFPKPEGGADPGSRLYLSTPNSDTWGRIPPYYSVLEMPDCPENATFDEPKWEDKHFHHYSRRELDSLLLSAGFKVLQTAESKSAGGTHMIYEVGVADNLEKL